MKCSKPNFRFKKPEANAVAGIFITIVLLVFFKCLSEGVKSN